MKVLLLLLFCLLAAYVNATPVSVMVWATYIKYAGNAIPAAGTLTTACNATFRHYTCAASAVAQPLLCRFPTHNVTSISGVSTTLKVVEQTGNFTIADSWAQLFTDKGGGRYLGSQLQFNSSSGAVEWWSGCQADGKTTAVGQNCGGNWTSSTTGYVGITGQENAKWIAFNATEDCTESKQILCACNSVAVPLWRVRNGWCNMVGFYTDDECNLFVGLLTPALFVVVVIFGGLGFRKVTYGYDKQGRRVRDFKLFYFV